MSCREKMLFVGAVCLLIICPHLVAQESSDLEDRYLAKIVELVDRLDSDSVSDSREASSQLGMHLRKLTLKEWFQKKDRAIDLAIRLREKVGNLEKLLEHRSEFFAYNVLELITRLGVNYEGNEFLKDYLETGRMSSSLRRYALRAVLFTSKPNESVLGELENIGFVLDLYNTLAVCETLMPKEGDLLVGNTLDKYSGIFQDASTVWEWLIETGRKDAELELIVSTASDKKAHKAIRIFSLLVLYCSELKSNKVVDAARTSLGDADRDIRFCSALVLLNSALDKKFKQEILSTANLAEYDIVLMKKAVN